MDITCGTDIIEIERVKKLVQETNEESIKKIFSEEEIKYCESKKNMKYQHYAARFAAKEAIFKAISCNLSNKFDMLWNDVEVINDKEGRPEVNFLCKKLENINKIDISLSHCKEFAIAMVIITWN